MITEARENYQTLYQEEEELNDTFRQFVLNYKAAYEGRNTRNDQIFDGAAKNVNNTDHRECIKKEHCENQLFI